MAKLNNHVLLLLLRVKWVMVWRTLALWECRKLDFPDNRFPLLGLLRISLCIIHKYFLFAVIFHSLAGNGNVGGFVLLVRGASGVSSGSNRHSINKQAFPSRWGRWKLEGGGCYKEVSRQELATRHSPISPFAICHSCVVLVSDIIHTNVWASSCACCSFSSFHGHWISPSWFFYYLCYSFDSYPACWLLCLHV